jgi:hypothetical protein
VQLEFTAPSDCAAQAQFAQQVRQRSERIEFRTVANKQLAITIQGNQSAWTGRAAFTDSDQEPMSREITARSCDEVVDGLALVTVMVLDPDAIQNSGSDHPPTLAAEAPRVTPQSNPTPVAPPTSVPATSNRKSAPHLGLGLSAAVGAKAGPAPSLMWGWGASANLNLERPSTWSPQMRMTALMYSKDAYLERGGMADFSMLEFQLSVCPLVLRHKQLRLRPCLAASYGRLNASGTRTFVPASESVAWLEGDVQVEVTWQPISMLMLFIAPTAGIPFKRYSFGFEPYVFHQVPSVILSGIAGVGLRLL